MKGILFLDELKYDMHLLQSQNHVAQHKKTTNTKTPYK